MLNFFEKNADQGETGDFSLIPERESITLQMRINKVWNRLFTTPIYLSNDIHHTYITSQTILGIEPDRRVRRSDYTAAKCPPGQRARHGDSLTTGNTVLNARQNRLNNALAYGGVCLKEREVN